MPGAVERFKRVGGWGDTIKYNIYTEGHSIIIYFLGLLILSLTYVDNLWIEMNR